MVLPRIALVLALSSLALECGGTGSASPADQPTVVAPPTSSTPVAAEGGDGTTPTPTPTTTGTAPAGATPTASTTSDTSPTPTAPTTAAPDPTTPTTAVTAAPPLAPERLTIEVLARYPHDPAAFTQGLELHDGRLYESTGLTGRSSVRVVDVTSGVVLQRRDLDAALFGEGLTRVGDQLVQLTWRNGVGLRWDAETLEPEGTFPYQGEGWGLCEDGTRLVQSDGSDQLQFRDPVTFALQGRVAVHDGTRSVANLNELECVDGAVFANVWGSDEIVRVDPDTGAVTAWIDASSLRGTETDVLNGIAYDASDGTFLLTGKLWSTLYRVRLT